MNAISGTRRAMKEMADGTIRVQVDIDPTCRGAFLTLFPNIDMPVALAPLVSNFEHAKGVDAHKQAEVSDKPKGGDLSRLAAQLCQNPDFLAFLQMDSEAVAADHIRDCCGITSRSELDHNAIAAQQFHEVIRKPFLAWKEGRA
ncbi:hypothetical protein [Orrella dioscoreae]|nr:hypothetical protein [Orrella dioscoreae]